MYNSFAQSLMRKYGWSQGDGLGKNNQGIIEPVKATLKFDSHGLAYKEIDTDLTSRWSNMYSSMASNLQIEDGNRITLLKENEDTEKLNKIGAGVLYKSFVKSNVILKDGLEVMEDDNKEKKSKKRKKQIADDEPLESKKAKKQLIDINESCNELKQCEKDKKKKKKRDENLNEDIVSEVNENLNKTEKKKKKNKKSKNKIIDGYQQEADQLETKLETIDQTIKKKKGKVIEEITIESSVKKSKKSKNKIIDECQKGNDQSVAKLETPVETIKKKKKDHLMIANELAVIPNSSFMTCFPAARCGIGMSGKLARIQKLHDEENKRKGINITN